jgi:superoxide dismutase, Cu-Zn family
MFAKPTLLLFCSTALLASCASVAPPSNRIIATATLLAADGSARGDARLVADGDRLMVEVEGVNLPAGEHGAHLHAVASCDPPGFTAAGPHLNPHAKQHGTLNPQGSHLGDLPNLTVVAGGNGSLKATVAGSLASLEAQLFDADGTAIVIHATADDYRTDPSGNSGGRIACGAFARVS